MLGLYSPRRRQGRIGPTSHPSTGTNEMTMTHSDDIRMILSNLSRLDDATERAALDLREKAAYAEPGLKEREALRGRKTVPYIVEPLAELPA